jgi:hypothetical protein
VGAWATRLSARTARLRGLAVAPNRLDTPPLEPFPNLGGLFFRKHTPQPSFGVEHCCAYWAFAEVSEQGGTWHCFPAVGTAGWRGHVVIRGELRRGRPQEEEPGSSHPMLLNLAARVGRRV